MKKPNYNLVKKARRPNAPWYIRRYYKGVRTDINLETTDRKEAELELMRVKLAAEEMAISSSLPQRWDSAENRSQHYPAGRMAYSERIQTSC